MRSTANSDRKQRTATGSSEQRPEAAIAGTSSLYGKWLWVNDGSYHGVALRQLVRGRETCNDWSVSATASEAGERREK